MRKSSPSIKSISFLCESPSTTASPMRPTYDARYTAFIAHGNACRALARALTKASCTVMFAFKISVAGRIA